MNAEFIEALNALEKERGISKDVLISAIEAALNSAYKRNYGSSANVRSEVDPETGDIHIYASKSVVEQVENPTSEISLADAKKVNALYEVGDVLEEEVHTRDFGRIAAQTAKQVVVQRIREAERGVIYEEYVEKENEVLTAIVQRVEKGNVYVELGKTDGLLTPNESIPGETYENNDPSRSMRWKSARTTAGRRSSFPGPIPAWSSASLNWRFPKSSPALSRSSRSRGKPDSARRSRCIPRTCRWTRSAHASVSAGRVWSGLSTSSTMRRSISSNGTRILRSTSQRR